MRERSRDGRSGDGEQFDGDGADGDDRDVGGVPHARGPGGSGPGWWYDDAARTLHVRTAALPTATAHTLEQDGGEVRD